MGAARCALAGVSIAAWLLLGATGQGRSATLAVVSASPEFTQADGGAMGEQAYWRFVDLAVQRLAQIEAAPPESAAKLLSATIAEWEGLQQVQLQNGITLPVGHRALLALLTAEPPDLAGARSLLQRMQQARRSWPNPRHGAPSLETLERVLSRDEFRWESQQPGRLQQWISDLRGRLLDLWYAALDRAAGLLGSSRVFRWAVFAVAALILAWAIARGIRRVLSGLVQEVGPEVEHGEAAESLSAQEALQLAHELSQVGDFRSAVRYLYISSLISLEEKGILRRDRSRTNREYLRMLADRPELAGSLREVVEVFDRVWYGFQRLDQASFARYAARVEDLRRSR